MKKNVFLAVALLALMAAATYAQTERDFRVTSSGRGITITGYVGTGTTVNIPPRIQNLPVTTIGANAFRGNNRITSVTIPNSVTIIEQNAFVSCGGLLSVTFSEQIQKGNIHQMAFDGDLYAKFFETNAASGTPGTYTRPNSRSGTWMPPATAANSGTTTDGFRWEREGNGIKIVRYEGTATTVVIPDRINHLPVTIIGREAFANNNSITSVTIQNGVTSIEVLAFSKCSYLERITIPNTVTRITNWAFEQCFRIGHVTFRGTIPSAGFGPDAFSHSGAAAAVLRSAFYETDATNGTPGTYTKNYNNEWTRQ